MAQELTDIQKIFKKHYQPLFKKHIKGESVNDVASELGCSSATVYGYLGGKIPDIANTMLLIEVGKKILTKLEVKFKDIS